MLSFCMTGTIPSTFINTAPEIPCRCHKWKHNWSLFNEVEKAFQKLALAPHLYVKLFTKWVCKSYKTNTMAETKSCLITEKVTLHLTPKWKKLNVIKMIYSGIALARSSGLWFILWSTKHLLLGSWWSFGRRRNSWTQTADPKIVHRFQWFFQASHFFREKLYHDTIWKKRLHTSSSTM